MPPPLGIVTASENVAAPGVQPTTSCVKAWVKGAPCALVIRPRVSYNQNDEILWKLAQVPEQSEFNHNG